MDRAKLLEKLETAQNRSEIRRALSEGRELADAQLVEKLCARAESLERRDPQRSLVMAEAAVRISDLLGDPVCLASSIRCKATALRAMGKYRRSIELYDRASRSFCEHDLAVEAARTEVGRIAALKYLGRYEGALAGADWARNILQRYGEELDIAKLDANVGGIYQRLDRYEEALDCYNQARRVFAKNAMGTFVAQVDVNRASVLTELSKFRQAEEAYLQARDAFEAVGQTATVAMIDANLGFLYSAKGRYNQALERLNLARRAFEQLETAKNVAVVDLDLADVYLALNLSDEALELAERAGRTCERLGMRLEAAQALASQAFAQLQLNRRGAAEALLAAARKAFETEGNQVWVATLDLHRAALLSQSTAAEDDVRRTLALTQQAQHIFRRQGLLAKLAYAQLTEGRLREKLGGTKQAVRAYRSALGIASRLRLPWLLHQIHYSLGRLEASRASFDKARRHYLMALEALEGMWGDLRPEDLRTAFLASRLQVYEDLVLLSLKGGPAAIAEAYQYVERAKSRALVELLAGRLEARVKDPDNEGLATYLTQLREELNWLYTRLSDGEPPGGRSCQSWSDEIAEQIKEREVQIGRILRHLHIKGEEYASLQQVNTCSLEAAQHLLDGDTSIVEYYLAGNEVIAFVISQQNVEVKRDLCSRDRVSTLRDMLLFQLGKFNVSQAYVQAHLSSLCLATNECLRQLYDQLIRPIRPLLQGHKVIVVPHDLLHCLPFHAFYDGGRYFADDFEISYSPSASVLHLCCQRPIRSVSKALIMGLADDRAPMVTDEVCSLANVFDSPLLLTGDKATVAALRQHSPGCEVVHIASHGVFSPTNPMFSRIRLADSWVSVHDVYNLKLDASLVTLSACETGLNRVTAGDEIIGLARGFLYAGTSSLLLSLWAVHDRSTVQLMRSFYRNFVAGQGKAEALRRAQLEVKDEYAHPYYWAPFVLVGSSN